MYQGKIVTKNGEKQNGLNVSLAGGNMRLAGSKVIFKIKYHTIWVLLIGRINIQLDFLKGNDCMNCEILDNVV